MRYIESRKQLFSIHDFIHTQRENCLQFISQWAVIVGATLRGKEDICNPPTMTMDNFYSHDIVLLDELIVRAGVSVHVSWPHYTFIGLISLHWYSHYCSIGLVSLQWEVFTNQFTRH